MNTYYVIFRATINGEAKFTGWNLSLEEVKDMMKELRMDDITFDLGTIYGETPIGILPGEGSINQYTNLEELQKLYKG